MSKKSFLFYLMLLCFSALTLAAPKLLEGSLEYRSTLMNIDITYPVLISGTNQAAIDRINSTIKRDTDNFYHYFLNYQKQPIRESLKYDGHISYDITLNEADLLSVNITYYEFTGGAHGTYELVNYTFDTKTGKRLTLKDLFFAEFNYKEFIESVIAKEIEANKSEYFEDAIQTLAQSNFSFYLEPEKLVIYYGLYEITPYCNGIPTFNLPLSLCQDKLLLKW